jgi:sugar phosphate isomerase/epimerase
MKINQIAAQLYTVRDSLKTPADVAKSLKQIRKIGYEAVQVSGVGPIESTELRKIIDGEGLVCCATHEPSQTILDEPSQVVDTLNALDCEHTAYPFPRGIDFTSQKDVKQLIKKLDDAGAVLRKAGKTLSYHNHAIEFLRMKDKTILEMIYEGTNPENLKAELDTHWVQAGGGSSASWCRRMSGRMPLIHLKDFRVDDKSQREFAEIGHGNMDWKEIISAAEASGCHWFIIEQDSNWADNDPFKSLKMSFRFLKEHIAEK